MCWTAPPLRTGRIGTDRDRQRQEGRHRRWQRNGTPRRCAQTSKTKGQRTQSCTCCIPRTTSKMHETCVGWSDFGPSRWTLKSDTPHAVPLPLKIPPHHTHRSPPQSISAISSLGANGRAWRWPEARLSPVNECQQEEASCFTHSSPCGTLRAHHRHLYLHV